MMQIVVPMAGRGSRFANAGFSTPKPLIPVGGKPMIQWVVENIRPSQPHRFTFICLREHLAEHPEVPATLRSLCPGCQIVTVNAVTEGAACTVLLARELIDNDDPLMIANADQVVELDIDVYLTEMERRRADGLIMSFEADHPKWSYCRLNAASEVTEVVEKRVVSNEATVGIYNFRHGRDFVGAADRMIRENLRTNGEFYVAPAYNMLIEAGRRIVTARTGREYDGMYGLGTPEDLAFFKTTELYNRRRVDGAPRPSATEAVAARTSQYVAFLGARNLAGMAALLADGITHEGPGAARTEGKAAVLAGLASLFGDNPGLSLHVRRFIADGAGSIVEFSLRLADGERQGADVLDWQDGRISRIRTYLR